MPGRTETGEEILQGLNQEQREAVCHTDGPLLILAGAGSGKTRVIIHRIAYLLETGRCLPYQFMALTFTNKAAGEMKERINQFLSSPERLWISTFHGAAARILRGAIHLLGYERNFTILDTGDQLGIIRDSLKELDMNPQNFNPKKVLNTISSAKNELIDESLYEEMALDYFSRKVSQVYYLYQKKLRESNCLDFDDLLLLTIKLFREHPAVLGDYQERFRYILVDEYQDTNTAQYVMVGHLGGKHRNICVVGDDDQSIYQFRGADIRNILEFEKEYPEAKVIKLEENYRSQGNILEAAYHVVKNNQDRKDKKLWTARPPGDKIYYYWGRDEHEEARFVAQEIKENWDEHGEFAVLYRINAQSRVLEEAFMRENLPYTIYGGLRFYDRMEIKDILAYLRVVDNPGDSIALKRIINVPRRGIGKKTVERVESFGAGEGLSLFEALEQLDRGELARNTVKKLQDFVELIKAFQGMKEYLGVRELTEEIMEKSGYLRQLEEEGTQDARTRLENLQELVTVAQEFEIYEEDKSLTAFLTGVSLVSSAEEITESEPGKKVYCMTLHSSKGLEFPVVFIIGMEERLFPHSLCLESRKGLEEERRLFYVGCTRAMERIYLTRGERRTLYGSPVYNKPSRFLKELPPELVYDICQENRQGNWEDQEGLSAGESWSVGDYVDHKKWGKGKIKSVGMSGDDQALTISFRGVGTKVVVTTYAPLKKVFMKKV